MSRTIDPTRAGALALLRAAAAYWERVYDLSHDELDGRRAIVLRGLASELEHGGIERERLQDRCSTLLERARRAEDQVLFWASAAARAERRAKGWREAARRLRTMLVMLWRYAPTGRRALVTAARDSRGNIAA